MRVFKVTVSRRKSTDLGTPSVIEVLDDNGLVVFQCDGLELPWRGNRRMVSCIKADTYSAHRQGSSTFKRSLWFLEDKHGRQACMIHNGIWAGDTTKTFLTSTGKSDQAETHVRGCTLVGRGYDEVTWNGQTQYGICAGRKTLDEFMEATKDADALTVTYQWDDGAQPEDDA